MNRTLNRYRIYVHSEDDVPAGLPVYVGPKGGRYYETVGAGDQEAQQAPGAAASGAARADAYARVAQTAAEQQDTPGQQRAQNYRIVGRWGQAWVILDAHGWWSNDGDKRNYLTQLPEPIGMELSADPLHTRWEDARRIIPEIQFVRFEQRRHSGDVRSVGPQGGYEVAAPVVGTGQGGQVGQDAPSPNAPQGAPATAAGSGVVEQPGVLEQLDQQQAGQQPGGGQAAAPPLNRSQGRTLDLYRVYVTTGEQPPSGVQTHTGPRGGVYYEAQGRARGGGGGGGDGGVSLPEADQWEPVGGEDGGGGEGAGGEVGLPEADQWEPIEGPAGVEGGEGGGQALDAAYPESDFDGSTPGFKYAYLHAQLDDAGGAKRAEAVCTAFGMTVTVESQAGWGEVDGLALYKELAKYDYHGHQPLNGDQAIAFLARTRQAQADAFDRRFQTEKQLTAENQANDKLLAQKTEAEQAWRGARWAGEADPKVLAALQQAEQQADDALQAGLQRAWDLLMLQRKHDAGFTEPAIEQEEVGQIMMRGDTKAGTALPLQLNFVKPEDGGVDRLSGADRVRILGGVRVFQQLVPARAVNPQAELSMTYTGSRSRSYCACTVDKATGAVQEALIAHGSAGGDRTQRTIHELGHWLEAENNRVQQARHAFLQAAWLAHPQESRPQELWKLQPRHGYLPEEISRPDRLPDPYMGKIYGSDSRTSEAVSMALELYYADPYKLAKQHPETFKFVHDELLGARYETGHWNTKHARAPKLRFDPDRPTTVTPSLLRKVANAEPDPVNLKTYGYAKLAGLVSPALELIYDAAHSHAKMSVQRLGQHGTIVIEVQPGAHDLALPTFSLRYQPATGARTSRIAEAKTFSEMETAVRNVIGAAYRPDYEAYLAKTEARQHAVETTKRPATEGTRGRA